MGVIHCTVVVTFSFLYVIGLINISGNPEKEVATKYVDFDHQAENY